MDPTEAEFQRQQYGTIRKELLDSNKNAHEAVRWGHGTLAVMISAGLAAQSLRGIDVARVIYFGVVVPVFALVAFFLWFGEVVRQQRAYTFLAELECDLNPLINGSRQTLVWHHLWLKTKTTNPLQGLQFGHYRNIALGFWFWFPVSGALSLWACWIATDHAWIRVIWSLFVASQTFGVVALYHELASRNFEYNLLEWIFAVPWASYLSVSFRVAVFAALGAHIINIITIQPIEAVFLCIAYITTDLIDGYLVRRFCSRHAAAFEFLDRALDMAGVAALVFLLGLEGKLNRVIVWTILIREGGLALTAIILSVVKRRPFSVSGIIGRIFHLFVALLILGAILNINMPGVLVTTSCISIAAISMIIYIRHPRLREIANRSEPI